MALRSISTRRFVRPIVALAVVGTGMFGLAESAHAASSVTSDLEPGSCISGTVNRPVTLSYSTTADFTTAFRVHAVTGSPTGPIVQTIEKPIDGPGGDTVTFNLPAGVYYFDWEDADGGGVWSGRHSGLSDFYLSVVDATRTPVAECVVATTTTAAATTTTIATTTTAAATTTTIAVGVPTTQTAATTSTTIAVNVPTTAVVQTTAAASANTLPATGANSTPLIAAGVAFLGLGSVAVLSTRRRRPAPQL